MSWIGWKIMRIHLIRHGDPDYSIDSLTPKGHTEAAALAEYLKREARVKRVFSSPMGRAQDTARYTAEALGLPVETEDWTLELQGLRMEQGCSTWDRDGHVMRQKVFPDIGNWLGFEEWSHLPNLDHIQRLEKHSDEFLAGLGYVREGEVYRVEQRNEDTYALFAHGGFGLTWMAHLLHIPPPMIWSGFFLHPSSITTILWDERVPGIASPRLIGVSALPHLAMIDHPPSDSGIKGNYY